jgi:hypothetical protein
MYYIDRTDQKLKRLRDCVIGYRDAGLGVCRLDPEEKNPIYRGWSTVSLDDPDLFDVTDNIGILAGWLSDGGRPGHALVVIDLDAVAAILAADRFLPATGMIEGRPGKPRSHRYYLVPVGSIPPEYVSTAEQSAPAALAAGKHAGPAKQQFRDRDGTLLVEILGSGQQAAAPPSIHPSGEVREWEGGTMGTPAAVPWPDLLAAVRRLAAACGWVPEKPKPVRGGKAASVPQVPNDAKESKGSHVPLSERLRRARQYLTESCGGTGIPGTTAGRGADARCFNLACKLVHGFVLDPDEALPLLEAWGQRDDQTDEDGDWFPWSSAELMHKLRDADLREDRAGRPRGYLLTERDDLPEPDLAALRKHFFGSRVG